MDLAYAECYMALATIFRRFRRRVEWSKTERERDVDAMKVFFISSPPLESMSVRTFIEKL